MKLKKCLETSKLIYWNNFDSNIEISENAHYRWLSFNGVIQSIMSRRQPWKLIFPHQYAMMMPLLFFKPKSIFEAGLGGGGAARFIYYLSTTVEFHSIEISDVVISCFQNYFSPQSTNINIINNNFIIGLTHQKHQTHSWYLFDIYKNNNSNFEVAKKIEDLMNNTPSTAFLSINLPHFEEAEINQLLNKMRTNCTERYIYYLDIAHYKNLVIIVFPKNALPTFLQKDNLLPQHKIKRWQNLWSHAKVIKKL